MSEHLPPLLLQTKLVIPALPDTLVSRPRLLQQLERGLWQNDHFTRKLTLVTAPAGYGKSTLLADWIPGWARSRREQGQLARIGWLSLDEDDNDIVRFLIHLFAALGYEKGNREMARAVGAGTGTLPAHYLLTLLLNHLADAGTAHLLVLDDTHLLEADPVQEALRFLLRHQPPVLHLVLAGRSQPAGLPLARLRVRAELRELGVQALRFTPAETGHFFREVALAPSQLRTVQTTTEGWVAALQLTRLTVQRERPLLPGRPVDPTTVGDGRYLLDYLAGEVLAHLSPATVSFLEQTAILQQLSAPLCDAVTGREDSRGLLPELVHSGLFLIPLAEGGEWYRYHPLFARFLLARLQQAAPALVPRLHRRAAGWHEEQGIVHGAVRHALATGDEGYALSLIERYRPWLLARGELSTLRSWVEALPGSVIDRRPTLALAYSWALLVGGEGAATEALLKRLEPVVEAQHEGELLALRTATARFRGDDATVRALSKRALAALPAGDYRTRSLVTLYRAAALLKHGEPADAMRLMMAAYHEFRARGDAYMETQALYHLITAHIFLGQLAEADTLCQQAFTVMEAHDLPYVVGGFHYQSGLIRWERNELDAAAQYLRQGYQIGQAGGHDPFAIRNCLLLAEVLLAQGDQAALGPLLAEARQLAAGSPRDAARVARMEALLALRRGHSGAASRWLEQRHVTLDSQPDAARFLDYLLLARLYLFRGRHAAVHPLLERLLELAEKRGTCAEQLEALLALARSQWAAGRKAVALRTVERALIRGEAGGYVRRFVDGGAEVAQILAQLRSRYHHGTPAAVPPAYLARVLAAFDPELVPQQAPADQPESFTLSEPLTSRETEIVQLLGQGLTNPQMAEVLHIAVGTVNWHVKNIYKKLRVGNRVEATVRAQELGLLS